MKVVHCVQPTYFDVDETLVLWRKTNKTWPMAIQVSCHNQVAYDDDGKPVLVPAWAEMVVPNTPVIERMRQHKARGHTIIVWSQGGDAWAEAVVKALGLEDIVDLVIEKPQWFYDDLPAGAFMGEASRIHLDLNRQLEEEDK